jgi:hypothetical protein
VQGVVGLDGPAPPGGVQVDINGPMPDVAFVNEGLTEGTFLLSFANAPWNPGDYLFEARLGADTEPAEFHVVGVVLNVNTAGNGAGTVTSSPGGIQCPAPAPRPSRRACS